MYLFTAAQVQHGSSAIHVPIRDSHMPIYAPLPVPHLAMPVQKQHLVWYLDKMHEPLASEQETAPLPHTLAVLPKPTPLNALPPRFVGASGNMAIPASSNVTPLTSTNPFLPSAS